MRESVGTYPAFLPFLGSHAERQEPRNPVFRRRTANYPKPGLKCRSPDRGCAGRSGENIVEWKDSYSLGIEEIDNQHKRLLRGFTAIEDAISSGKGWSFTHFAVLELRTTARAHFMFEEGLMRLFGFPKTEILDHSREHEQFFRKLDDIERHSIRDSAEKDMVDFLRRWLAEHILATDKSYAAHILTGAKIVSGATA